ncbi:MAG: regulatory iron-sulfur-containing complex subunit RicT [Eggerthellaceae bacterium]|nr:regulatory iron-sulfur-containing complex subunit RicT [Eggerthellaceae bacterium]
MVRVAPINLTYNPRTLWFNPGDIDVRKGDAVVVETARGVEYGRAASDIIEVSDKEIKALKSPLKRVVRLASDDDDARARQMEERGREALPVFKEMVAEAGIDMHPVSVEYLLDGDKAVFYFEAEDRVDFRDLVRKLAARFHVRIDMRQIGVRDEARMVGGLGHCGQELCCKRMGGDFNPVSIRMAKEQDLSLNPQKISGLCGRLMCCLRYEYEAYKDFKSRAPKANATIDTPQGPAKVVDLNVPREVVSLKVEGEKPVKVPLADFDAPKEGSTRPSSVGEDAWEAATNDLVSGYGAESATFLTSQFTGSDKLAEAGSVRHTPGGKRKQAGDGRGSDAGSGGRGRSRGKGGSSARGKGARGSSGGTGGAGSEHAASGNEGRKRRRSTKIAAGDGSRARQGKDAGTSARASQEPAKRKERSRDNGRAKQGAQRSGEGRKARDSQASGRPRPGQKSSGLARERAQAERAGANAGAGAEGSTGSAHRRSRRRSHKSGSGAGAQRTGGNNVGGNNGGNAKGGTE